MTNDNGAANTDEAAVDIVERLRNGPYSIGRESGQIYEMIEAADEIETLRAQLTAATADADSLRVQLAQTIMQQDEAWQAMKERAEQLQGKLARTESQLISYIKATGFDDDAACLICKGVHGCSHTFSERFKAAPNPRAEQAERMLAEAVAALAAADDAIREMFRYYHGGETRGSYDGKPERAQLQRAGYVTTRTLTTIRSAASGEQEGGA